MINIRKLLYFAAFYGVLGIAGYVLFLLGLEFALAAKWWL